MKGITIVNDSDFESEVLQSAKPVVVDFCASWCGPCRILTPIIEQVAGELGDSVKICKLDVDESKVFSEKYQVMSVPTVIIFKDGQIAEKFVGVHTKPQIIEKIQKVI